MQTIDGLVLKCIYALLGQEKLNFNMNYVKFKHELIKNIMAFVECINKYKHNMHLNQLVLLCILKL